MSTTVYIDADNCPNLVLDYTNRYCINHSIPLILVANHEIKLPGGKFTMIITSKDKDSADDYIADNTDTNDLVITKDILLASRLVEKQIKVINDRGNTFDKYNINDRLLERDFDFQLTQLGLGGKKGSSYNEKQLAKFTSCFENAIRHLCNS